MTGISASFDDRKVHINWGSGKVSHFHNIWLRDHCRAETHFHPLTKQRLQNTFDIPEDVHASAVQLTPKDAPSHVQITWAHDGFVSMYSLEWLQLHSYDPVLVAEKTAQLQRQLWTPTSISTVLPQVEFDVVMGSEKGVAEWTNKIYEHGFCLVNNVPRDLEATEKLVERIAYIRPTHYGGFWDFTADMAKNDTAYTNLYLASHTDGTYWSDTPGLQLFHLLHHVGKGGETMLVDGFAAAQQLKDHDPDSYDFLSRIKIPAHSAGEEDVCITPTMPMPIFTHHSVTGELVQVRWNNDDRSTMDQWESPDDVDKFYKAIRLWKKILLENEIVYKLTPGTCLIFDNWRVLHGRKAFDGNRRMCGAYINRDDFISRLRLLNLGRECVLRSL